MKNAKRAARTETGDAAWKQLYRVGGVAALDGLFPPGGPGTVSPGESWTARGIGPTKAAGALPGSPGPIICSRTRLIVYSPG